MSEKKIKTRSPGYPGIDLEQAIKKARVVWDHAKRNAVSAEVVAKYWKYGEKSSGWRTSIAALKRFGLLDSVGNKKSGDVQLTDLALRILLDVREPSPEREAAIKEAALRPAIYQELWTHWGGNVPPDDTAQTYLTLNKGFGEATVRDFISDFKKTIEFAKLGPADIIPSAGGKTEEEENGEEDQDRELKRAPRRRSMQTGMKEDVFTLEEGQVVLQMPEKLSQESFEDFESWLGLIIRKAKRSVRSEDDEPDDEE